MTSPAPVVFLVDDDPAFLTGASRLLRAEGFQVMSFPSAAAFLAGQLTDVPGCVIADLNMPGMNGIELQSALATMENPRPVIFLTGQGDIPSSVTAMRQGAEDFLTKLAPREKLLDAVKRALQRDTVEREQRARIKGIQTRLAKLTSRDHEVLTHVLRGRLNKQIAADLGIDERSVKRHRTSVMTKLSVQSVAELIHLTHEAGIAATIIQPPPPASVNPARP